MPKNNIRKAVVACMVMLTFACRKDDQSFTYDKINNVTVESASTAITVSALDSLIITPKLIESMPSGEEYTYRWTIGTATYPANKDLRIKVELAPGSYSAVFKATSKKTGISALARYAVTVNGAFYQGWYVVNNKAGKAQLSFIRADDVLFENPAETVNKKTYSGKALSSYATSSLNLIYFFTDQNAYRFNANDLLELSDKQGTLPFASAPFTSVPYYGLSHSQGNFDQYIIADGGLYAGLGPGFFPAEVLKPFSDRFAGDYHLFPAVITPSLTSTFFYDNKYMRFMQVPYLGRDIGIAPATTSASFNLANVGRTMIAFDRGVTNEFYYIMQNSTGRYLMSTTALNPGINQQISNSPDINIASNFATSSVLKQMYYAAGNKIYLYDIIANSSRLIYTFPVDYVIKDIELLRSTSKRLVVAANKGTEGEVYYFDIDALGLFANNTFVKRFEGFGDIVHVNFR